MRQHSGMLDETTLWNVGCDDSTYSRLLSRTKLRNVGRENIRKTSDEITLENAEWNNTVECWMRQHYGMLDRTTLGAVDWDNTRECWMRQQFWLLDETAFSCGSAGWHNVQECWMKQHSGLSNGISLKAIGWDNSRDGQDNIQDCWIGQYSGLLDRTTLRTVGLDNTRLCWIGQHSGLVDGTTLTAVGQLSCWIGQQSRQLNGTTLCKVGWVFDWLNVQSLELAINATDCIKSGQCWVEVLLPGWLQQYWCRDRFYIQLTCRPMYIYGMEPRASC